MMRTRPTVVTTVRSHSRRVPIWSAHNCVRENPSKVVPPSMTRTTARVPGAGYDLGQAAPGHRSRSRPPSSRWSGRQGGEEGEQHGEPVAGADPAGAEAQRTDEDGCGVEAQEQADRAHRARFEVGELEPLEGEQTRRGRPVRRPPPGGPVGLRVPTADAVEPGGDGPERVDAPPEVTEDGARHGDPDPEHDVERGGRHVHRHGVGAEPRRGQRQHEEDEDDDLPQHRDGTPRPVQPCRGAAPRRPPPPSGGGATGCARPRTRSAGRTRRSRRTTTAAPGDRRGRRHRGRRSRGHETSSSTSLRPAFSSSTSNTPGIVASKASSAVPPAPTSTIRS